MTPHDLVAPSDYGHPTAAWLGPALADQRVLLRPPAPGDEPALVEMATDERVRHYLGGPADEQTAAVTAAQKTAAPSWGQFVIVDRASGEVAGSGSLARKRGPWEISYQLRHQFWGRQLALSTVVLIRDWFFAHMPDDVLIGTTQQANERSRRVLQRAGAVLTGTFTQYGKQQERYDFVRGAAG
jgi:ribosomal-protein-alanine N-acetyltransferase